MKNIVVFAILAYQRIFRTVRPHLTGVFVLPPCRFFPSCSDYGIKAVMRYGVARGIFLATRRIMRCNALFVGGLDEA